MSFTKAQIYNLALSSLLLARQVVNVETDKSNEVAVLNQFYDVAVETLLEDLDLDSTSQPVVLELLANLTDNMWLYAYKYPSNCAFLRRIQSNVITDNRNTLIDKRIGIYEGEKAIFTNEEQAIGECIPKDFPLEAFSPMAGLALAYNLASLSAPLITGKGAKSLQEKNDARYLMAKSKAQEKDTRENFRYEEDSLRSEFIEARLS